MDMSWLTEQSIPLFLSFVALQLMHETAHLAVAKSKNVSFELVEISCYTPDRRLLITNLYVPDCLSLK